MGSGLQNLRIAVTKCSHCQLQNAPPTGARYELPYGLKRRYSTELLQSWQESG